MKKLVIFYSWSGKTRDLAKSIAEKESADIFEVKDVKKPGKFIAYTAGCFKALGMKPGRIEPITANFDNYDEVVIMAPTWAGHPAPPVICVFEALPPNKAVSLLMVSASGKTDAKDKIDALLKEKGCQLVKYEDLKS